MLIRDERIIVKTFESQRTGRENRFIDTNGKYNRLPSHQRNVYSYCYFSWLIYICIDRYDIWILIFDWWFRNNVEGRISMVQIKSRNLFSLGTLQLTCNLARKGRTVFCSCCCLLWFFSFWKTGNEFIYRVKIPDTCKGDYSKRKMKKRILQLNFYHQVWTRSTFSYSSPEIQMPH